VKRRNYYAALSAVAWPFRSCNRITTNIHSASLCEYWWWSKKL